MPMQNNSLERCRNMPDKIPSFLRRQGDRILVFLAFVILLVMIILAIHIMNQKYSEMQSTIGLLMYKQAGLEKQLKKQSMSIDSLREISRNEWARADESFTPPTQ